MDLLISAIPLISLMVAGISLFIAYKSSRNLNANTSMTAEVSKAVESSLDLTRQVSKLINSSAELGVTMIYKNRADALNQYWRKHISESKEVVILGTSLLGLTSALVDVDSILTKNPEKFKFLIVHPDSANSIENQEGRFEGTIKSQVSQTLHLLRKCGVKQENVKLFHGVTRNFVIMTEKRILINPTVYGNDAFRFFCIECENKHEEDIYHQYKKNHYEKVWSSNLSEELDYKQALNLDK